MKFRNWNFHAAILWGLFGFQFQFAHGADICGIASVSDPGDDGCLAVYSEIDPGQNIVGVRWFNNDSESVFPQVRLIRGDAGGIVGSEELIHEWREVTGASSGWSELDLPSVSQPVGEGCYVLFVFPANVSRDGRGQGTGPGIGYISGGKGSISYISQNQKEWIAVDDKIRFAVELVTVQSINKSLVEVPEEDGIAPVFRTGLNNPWPNPANPSLNVSFSLAKKGLIELSIYDIRGHRVRNLLSEQRSAGPHTVIWSGIDNFGSPVSSGVYLLKMVAGKESFTRQVTLLK